MCSLEHMSYLTSNVSLQLSETPIIIYFKVIKTAIILVKKKDLASSCVTSSSIIYCKAGA